MVQYLLRHPLVLAVGSEKGGEGAETHLLDASEALRAQPDGFKGGVLFKRLGNAHGTGSLGDVLEKERRRGSTIHETDARMYFKQILEADMREILNDCRTSVYFADMSSTFQEFRKKLMEKGVGRLV